MKPPLFHMNRRRLGAKYFPVWPEFYRSRTRTTGENGIPSARGNSGKGQSLAISDQTAQVVEDKRRFRSTATELAFCKTDAPVGV
jgi:hypothetical protein